MFGRERENPVDRRRFSLVRCSPVFFLILIIPAAMSFLFGKKKTPAGIVLSLPLPTNLIRLIFVSFLERRLRNSVQIPNRLCIERMIWEGLLLIHYFHPFFFLFLVEEDDERSGVRIIDH